MFAIQKILFDNEPVIGIRSPFDYLYIKILRFTLKLVNSWPSKELNQKTTSLKSKIQSFFITILTFTHFFGCILYICLRGSYLTFLEIGYGYLTAFMNVVIASRLLTLTLSTKYLDVAKEFLTQIHLFYYKDDSAYAMKTHKRIHTISHLFSMWLALQTFAGVIFFNIIPLYNFISSGSYLEDGTKELTYAKSVYILYPFHTYSSTRGYLMICVFNCVSSSLAAIWFCMFDLFLSVMVFHMWGHLNILLHKLKTFPKRSRNCHTGFEDCEMFSEIEVHHIARLLKDCIDYHRIIVCFTKKMSDAFGTMLFVYYMFHQVSGCLLLLECSTLSAGALIRYLPVTFILNQQLIQLSVIFELIGSTSEMLKHGVYALPWELMDVKNRKTVIIFLMTVQNPIHVKALGIANVGVTSMATILKTSLSYFMFLRSI